MGRPAGPHQDCLGSVGCEQGSSKQRRLHGAPKTGLPPPISSITQQSGGPLHCLGSQKKKKWYTLGQESSHCTRPQVDSPRNVRKRRSRLCSPPRPTDKHGSAFGGLRNRQPGPTGFLRLPAPGRNAGPSPCRVAPRVGMESRPTGGGGGVAHGWSRTADATGQHQYRLPVDLLRFVLSRRFVVGPWRRPPFFCPSRAHPPELEQAESCSGAAAAERSVPRQWRL